MRICSAAVLVLATLGWTLRCPAGDWNQWRGAGRDGVDPDSPPLAERLPAEGLSPIWISEAVPSGGNGGWGSPVVAEGKVYLFAHYQTPKPGVQLAPPEFPPLSEREKKKLDKQKFDEYERKRQQEDVVRRKAAHDFHEALFCFNAADGRTLWKNERPSSLTAFFQSGTPAVIEGKAYVLAAGGMARAVDATDGEDLWQTQLPGDFDDQCFMSSFAVAHGVAVVLAGRLFGLDAQTGELLWRGPEDAGGAHSSPVAWTDPRGSELVIANVAGGQTICVDPLDGRELWRVESGAELSTPLVVGDRLVTYGHDRAAGLRCYDLSSDGAQLRWAYKGAADKGSSPIAVDGYIYVQGGKRLACIDFADGKAQWQTRIHADNPQYTSPIAADGKVYYAQDGLFWFAADPARGRLLAAGKFNPDGLLATEETFRRLLGKQANEQELLEHTSGHGPLECSSPAIAGGRLYLRLKNSVACYDLRMDEALSARPRANLRF